MKSTMGGWLYRSSRHAAKTAEKYKATSTMPGSLLNGLTSLNGWVVCHNVAERGAGRIFVFPLAPVAWL